MDEFNDIIVDSNDILNNYKIDKDYITSINNNYIYNKNIAEYYYLFEKENNRLPKSKLYSIKNCNKFWFMDYYPINEIKDYIGTYLCKDKFCNNCKKVKQASRMARYIPELEKYKENLYHLILTIPNISGQELKSTIKKMSISFRKLIRYISCSSGYTIDFIDFNKYKYKGAIKSLEITFKNDNYHPHYHCALVFDNLELIKTIKNTYSFDNQKGREDTLFSLFEIEIQKLWYMIFNNIRINKDNFDNLELGYSCKCNKFLENDYAELFKYLTKETDELNNLLSYDNFKTLYLSTFHIKQIQGYGCLYRINDVNIFDECDKYYREIIDFLKLSEIPIEISVKPIDLLILKDNCKVISRKTIFKYLQDSKKTPSN